MEIGEALAEQGGHPESYSKYRDKNGYYKKTISLPDNAW
jgi:hypothetical protein